ncbi:beta-lactamase-like protein [Mycobacterium tuberculosis]|nr:beta-lactamase-like protein [Mycobacterium tuberculosis]
MTEDGTGSERLRRPARVRSVQIGELRISYVPDGSVELKPRAWLPEATEEDWLDHADHLDETGNLVASIGGLLVERGDRALLIDAGLGPFSVPAEPANPHGAGVGGVLLDSLATLGCPPATIEAVAFTHLHVDHVGWAWTPAPGSSAPAFTSGRYLISEPEWANLDLLVEAGTSREALDTLAPRVQTVRDGEEIFPGVRVQITGGHTTGHAMYVITSGNQRMIAFGDVMHSPVQVAHPMWSAASDLDRALSAQYRARLVDELAQPDTIGFGVHFADVPFGRVHQDERGTRWVPID